MRFLLGISKGIDAVTITFGRLMFWVTLFMVLIGAYNVITRYLGNFLGVQLSGNVFLEIQTYSYNLVFLLGASYVFYTDAHVRVDILFSRYSERTKAWVDIMGTLLFLIPFCAMGIYFSIPYVASSWRVMEMSPNPGGLPRYPIKTVIIIAFTLLIMQGISEIIKRIFFLRGYRDPFVPALPHDPEQNPVIAQVEAL